MVVHQTSATEPLAFNKSIIDMSVEPKLEDLKTHKSLIYTTATWRWLTRQQETSTRLDLPAYFVGISTTCPTDHQTNILLKGPTSKWHVPKRWNYIDNFCPVTPPTNSDDRQRIQASILWAANNERLFRRQNLPDGEFNGMQARARTT